MSDRNRIPRNWNSLRAMFLAAVLFLASLYFLGTPPQLLLAAGACMVGFGARKREPQGRTFVSRDQSLQWW